jgi:hypothetical protein
MVYGMTLYCTCMYDMMAPSPNWRFDPGGGEGGGRGRGEVEGGGRAEVR